MFPRLSPRGRDLSQSANGLRKITMRSLHSHAICAVWGFSILQTCSAFCASAPYPARVGRNRGQLRMVAHVEPVLTLLLADSAPSLRYNHVWTLFAVIVRVGSTRRTRTGRRRCCIAHSVSRRFNSPTCAPAQLHTPDTHSARTTPPNQDQSNRG